jgi:hypothetical protein
VELLMEFGIGSVVTIDNYSEQYVITGIKNYEDSGSCSYDRTYIVMKLEDIENKDYITQDEGIQIECKGTRLPLHKVENIAPFKLTKEIRYKVERMKAKIIYE